MLEIAERHLGLIGDVNELEHSQGSWSAVLDRFNEWFKVGFKQAPWTPFPGISGGATPLTSLRTRWDREAVTAGTGESHEVDFNIAFGQAIEISGVVCRIQMGANTATLQTMEALVDLDGPGLANDALSTQALFELREVLESVIANFGIGSDLLTSGGAPAEELQKYQFAEPILTARNVGTAFLSIVSAGEALIGIQYKLVEVSRDEQLLLFALGRA